ncbi:MAG: DMT family transporter [Clostridia bacterium]
MSGQKKTSAMALVVFAVCMVSYSGPMVKGALNEGASPISVALLRMVAAGVLLLPFDLRQCARQRIPFAASPMEWGWITLSALFLAGHYLTWITSLTGTSTFASVALVCTQPLFVALFSYLLFHEKLSRRALPGAILALGGALVIALAGMGAQQSAEAAAEGLRSNLLALVGAVLMAAHWLTARHIRQTLAAEVYTPALYGCTALLLAACLPLMGGFVMPVRALPYMAGLVIGSTLLGHAVFAFALSRVSANVVSFALLGEPVGAMVFSMLFFGEIPTTPVMIGGMLTLLGLALYLGFSREKSKKGEVELVQ